MGKQVIKERKAAAMCYRHLGGKLGEALFYWLVQKKWIRQLTETGEYDILEEGWNGLGELGVDAGVLRNTKRKRVCACIERHGGTFYPHAGAHLGELLAQRLMEMGWLAVMEGKQCTVTAAGLAGLRQLGVHFRTNE
jgi:hypothetical protein